MFWYLYGPWWGLGRESFCFSVGTHSVCPWRKSVPWTVLCVCREFSSATCATRQTENIAGEYEGAKTLCCRRIWPASCSQQTVPFYLHDGRETRAISFFSHHSRMIVLKNQKNRLQVVLYISYMQDVSPNHRNT